MHSICFPLHTKPISRSRGSATGSSRGWGRAQQLLSSCGKLPAVPVWIPEAEAEPVLGQDGSGQICAAEILQPKWLLEMEVAGAQGRDYKSV